MELLFLMLVIPFIGAFLAYFSKGRFSVLIATVFSFFTFCLSLINILSKQRFDYDFLFFRWLHTDISFGLINDSLTSIMLILITLIGFFVILYSSGYMSPHNADHRFYSPYGSYYFFMLLFIGAMVGIVTATNFLQIFFSGK